MNLTENEIDIVSKSWEDCQSLLGKDNFFIPETRFINSEDKVCITAIEKDDKDALFNYLQSFEIKPKFAVLNNCGYIREENKNNKCLISRIYKDEKLSEFYILKTSNQFVFDQSIISQAMILEYSEALKVISFVFDSPLSSKRTTVIPVLEELKEINKLIYSSKTDEDWDLFLSKLENIDINIQDGAGDTILHNIINKAPVNVIRTLLERNANPNIFNYKYERTPAYYATKPDIHKLLIEHNLNVNHCDSSGWTAAQYRLPSIEILLMHLNAGLDLSLQSNSGRTIVFEVVENGGNKSIEILDLLLKHGANFEIQDNWGLTPLHIAVLYNKHDIIEFFLNKYQNINIKTHKDYNLPFGDDPMILPANSTIKDLVKIIEMWLKSEHHSSEKEWIEDSKTRFKTTYQLVIKGESLKKIRNEKTKNRTNENQDSSTLFNYLKNYDQAEPLVKRLRSNKRKVTISIGVFVIGLIILIISLILKLSSLFGIATLILGVILFNRYSGILGEDIKQAKKIGLIK